jgi:glutathione synthase/RimK-type ligase-like ATP-grasp enzyme
VLLLDRLRHRQRLLHHLWALERRSNRRLPNIALISRGFLSNRAWLYPFDRFDPALFLTDLEVEARLPRLNTPDASAVLGDKQRFHQWAASAGVRTAALIGIFTDGQALAPDGQPLVDGAIGAAFIAKPVDGSGGRDVRIITALDALPRVGRFVLEELVTQHAYAQTVFPDAVNTIRVMVGQLPGAEPILIGAAHRFGTARSAPTDNFKAGGIVALVDLATGRLSEAVVDLGGPGRRTLSHHPATNARIAGVIVPEWQSVVSLAIRATKALPGLHYVGWDIAVTPSGPVVIEGNAGLSNPNLVQFHEPILLRPDVRQFFAESGVLSPRRLNRLESRLRQGTARPSS